MAVGTLRKRVADQREAGLMLADRRSRWPSKTRIDQRELPGRRGLLGQDAVAAAIEMQILGLVADLGERGQARSRCGNPCG